MKKVFFGQAQISLYICSALAFLLLFGVQSIAYAKKITTATVQELTVNCPTDSIADTTW